MIRAFVVRGLDGKRCFLEVKNTQFEVFACQKAGLNLSKNVCATTPYV